MQKTNTINTAATIKDTFPTLELFGATPAKVFLTANVAHVAAAPEAFKCAVAHTAASLEAVKATTRAATLKARVSVLTAKADTLEAQAAAHVGPALMVTVTVKGVEETITATEYAAALKAEADSVLKEAGEYEKRAAAFKAARDNIPAVALTEEEAKAVRVYAAAIFGGASALRANNCDGLKEAVKAAKTWAVKVADYVGPLDTTSREWKAMKDAVNAFMKAFEVVTGGAVVAPCHINLNSAEVEFLATKVFDVASIKWLNEGDNDTPAFAMKAVSGAARFETELARLLVLKYEGSRLAATKAPVKAGKGGNTKGGRK